MIGRWNDVGVSFDVELSTSGDLVQLGNQTDYPFVAGGNNGGPYGWLTRYAGAQATWATFNVTTDTSLNRFSVSTVAASRAGEYVIAEIDIPFKVGYAYRFYTDVRTMDTKASARFIVGLKGFTTETNFSYLAYTDGQTDTNWVTVTNGTVPIPSNVIRLQLQIQIGSSAAGVLYGGQYTNLYTIEVPPTVPPIEWRDITCDVMAMGIRYGRERFTNRYEVGTCSLTLKNDDGEYTYHANHPFGLEPGRMVKIVARHEGIDYPQFFGVIDTIGEGYSIEGHSTTVFQLIDPSSVFSNVKTPTIHTSYIVPLYPGERIKRLIDAVGYRDYLLDTGVFAMQPIEGSGRTIRDEIHLTAESEGGSFFADRDGTLIYEDRNWPTTDPKLMNVTADISAAPHVDVMPIVDEVPTLPDAPIICPRELRTDWSLARVINYVELANRGGTAKVYQDQASQKKHGIQTYSRMDFLLQSASLLDTRASDLMTGYAEPVLRVNSVEFNTAVNPPGEGWPWCLSVFLNWLIRVWYLHPRNDWGYAVVTHVQSIEHRITTRDWSITMAIDRPLAFTELALSSEFGWDGGIWDEALWDQTEVSGGLWSHGYLWSNAPSKWGE